MLDWSEHKKFLWCVMGPMGPDNMREYWRVDWVV